MNKLDKVKEFCKYFNNGANTDKRIGIELEHFIVRDGHTLSYDKGVKEILSKLAKSAGSVICEEGNILGCDMGEYTLTIEPGAQLEVSISPFANIADIERVMNEFYQKCNQVTSKYGAELVCSPTISERELENAELIPKKRYEYMAEYFKSSGTMGKYMMCGSASLQASVDYEDEADFVRKFRLAYIMSPFFAIMTGGKMRDGYLKRIDIWNNVDTKRTHIPKKLFDGDFGFEAYAAELLTVPAIYIPQKEQYIYTGEESTESLIDSYGLDEKLLAHYLSMVFPDVRLKNYIEIRIADSVPKKTALAYAALLKAVFYSDMLNILVERYDGITVTDIEKAKQEAMQQGINAEIYGFSAGEELEYLSTLTKKHLPDDEIRYLTEVEYEQK